MEAGHDVWLATRDPERGEAAAQELGARFVELDVTDERGVHAAAERVAAESGSLDVLVNNAGISGDHKPLDEVTAEDLQRVFDTNVFGIVRTTRAFLPLLERSENPVIVNVSSGMGSITVTSDPDRIESTFVGLPYPASKTAVNVLTSQYGRRTRTCGSTPFGSSAARTTTLGWRSFESAFRWIEGSLRRPLPERPATWSHKTAAQRSNAFGFRFSFAKPPTRPASFSRQRVHAPRPRRGSRHRPLPGRDPAARAASLPQEDLLTRMARAAACPERDMRPVPFTQGPGVLGGTPTKRCPLRD